MVSVIVPIYKVEPYLHQCVDSILVQTYTNLEIILVNDGSPDGCGAICDEYAAKDPRVKAIHKKNGGLSDARNAGLDIASGDFYCFVDSDDYLPDHSIATLLELQTKYDSDMVIAGFERFSDKDEHVFFSTETGDVITHVYTREEAMKDFFRDGCQAWAVLYKRHIHEDIRFPKGEINEDEAIIFHILERCSRVVVTNRVVYCYRNREDSITTSSFTVKKLVWYHHCVQNLLWIRSHHPELEELALHRTCISLLWSATELSLSKKAQPEIQAFITSKTREHYPQMHRIPILRKADRIRLAILRYLPFGVYRFLTRLRN